MNILYCRKSSEDSNRQVLSIESQKSNLLEVAASEKLTIDKIFTESMSAKDPGRPEFASMIALVKSHPGSTLLVWKLDRLARNPVDEGEIKWQLQIRTIAKIVTPERTYYPEDNALIASVEFGMANQYVRELSANVKRGNRTKLEKGELPGRAPIGYLDNKATRLKEVDPIRAPLVREMFELYATGLYSIKKLGAAMHGRGLKSRGGMKISKAQLHHILENPFYVGTIRRGGELYPGVHEPLVSANLFEDVQRVLSGKSRPRPQTHFFPLRGTVSCALCGCAYTATEKKGHTYYYCTNGRGRCEQHRKYTREIVADQLAANVLNEVRFCEEDIEIAYLAAREKTIARAGSSHTESESLSKQLKAVQQRLSNLVQVISLDPSMASTLKPQILSLEAEAKMVEGQISSASKQQTLDEALSALELTKNAFLQACSASFDYLNGDDAKKSEILKKLLWNFSLQDQTVQSYQFKSPFSLMAESPKKLEIDSWLGW